MMSQDNRLLPLSPETLDRPLRDLAGPPVAPAAPAMAVVSAEPAHLREYLAVVLKRKWLILSLMVVVTSLVAIQMYRLPSEYEAATQIQIEQRARSVLTTGRAGDLVIRANDPNYWNTQLAKLRTQKLARQVIMRLDLQNNPAFLGANRGTGIIAGLRRIITREKAKEAPKQDEGAVPILNEGDMSTEQLTPEQTEKLEPYEDMLRANLSVEPLERTNLVLIRFTHTDPQIAANVVNTLATVFRENDIIDETAGADRATTLLGNNIVELQAQIQRDQDARLAYMRGHKLPLGNKPGQNLTEVRLTNYSSQLQAAEADRKKAEAAWNAALKASTTGSVWDIPEVQRNENINKLRARMSELEEQRAALLVTYTEEWPAVKKIDEQLKKLKADMEKQPAEVIAAMKNRYEMARDEEAKLRASYFTEQSAANAQSTSEIGLSDLSQRIETNKQLYQTYLQRQRELTVTASDRTNNVSTVEEARIPRAPIGPPRDAQHHHRASCSRLGVGIGLAFLLDYLDDTLKSIEDVDRHLHLPTLALIPAPREARRFLGRGAAEHEPGDQHRARAHRRRALARGRGLPPPAHLAPALVGRPAAEDRARHFEPAFGGQDDDRRQHRHDAGADRRRRARPRLRPAPPARPRALRSAERARRDQLPLGRLERLRAGADLRQAAEPEGHSPRGPSRPTRPSFSAPTRCASSSTCWRRTSRTSSSTRRRPSRSPTPRSSRRWLTA